MAGARGLLINITGGDDMTLYEVDQAANRIREEVAEDANIIFGSAIDDSLSGRVRVSVVATGIDTPAPAEQSRPKLVAVGGGQPVSQNQPVIVEPAPEPMVMSGAPTQQVLPVTMAPSVAAASAPAPSAVPQPLRQASTPRPLFMEPARAPEPAQAPVPKTSLFGIVTGALRRTSAAQPVPELRRAEPQLTQELSADVQPASPRATPQGPDEAAGLDIPAFLRRQSN